MTSRIDGESVNSIVSRSIADPLAGGGRHAVLERADVVLVHPVGLLVAPLALRRLVLEALPLVDRVVQLGVGVGELPPADEELEAVDEARVARACAWTAATARSGNR